MHSAKHIVTIPTPCSENWDKMSPVQQGRFCASCQKTVVDFSQMTDAEVLRIFTESKGEMPCGRFHVGQLERELIVPSAAPPRMVSVFLKKAAAVALLFQGFGASSFAQVVKPATEQQPAKPGDKTQSQRVVKGRVELIDGEQQRGNIYVRLTGTDIVVHADDNGVFRIPLPDSLSLSMLTVEAYRKGRFTMNSGRRQKHYLGYDSVSIEEVMAGKQVTIVERNTVRFITGQSGLDVFDLTETDSVRMYYQPPQKRGKK